MDTDSLWKWLVAPGGLLAALLTWLFRRRLSGSWIGRRLNAEKDLIACRGQIETKNDELKENRLSFDRRLGDLMQEIQIKDQQIGYLRAALEALTRSAAQVLEVHDPASPTRSGNSPSAPSPSPTPSPTSRERPPASRDR